MDITHIGHSSFRIKGKHAVLVTDPFDPQIIGLKFPDMNADVVTISHQHPDHNYVKKISGEPLMIVGPGEYEAKGLRILGIQTYHDTEKGAQRGKNTLYVIEIDGIRIVHCGDVGHALDDTHTELIDGTDILMIPVGGHYTIGPTTAHAIITLLEPSIIIPMHYRTEQMNQSGFENVGTVQEFLKEMGKSDIAPQQKLTITKDKLPAEQTIVVLD